MAEGTEIPVEAAELTHLTGRDYCFGGGFGTTRKRHGGGRCSGTRNLRESRASQRTGQLSFEQNHFSEVLQLLDDAKEWLATGRRARLAGCLG